MVNGGLTGVTVLLTTTGDAQAVEPAREFIGFCEVFVNVDGI
jgi:hypothetical protein